MDGFLHFTVVINQEEQYSIWPTELPLPVGWRALECAGTKQECLDYVAANWRDIRPLSLRQRLAEEERLRSGG